MIIILSETLDITTDRVIDWLISFGCKDILRINDGTPIYVKHISIGLPKSEIILSANQTIFNLDEVMFFWYRRGLFKFEIKPSLDFKLEMEDYNKVFNFHNNEWYPVRNYIIKKLEQKSHLGNFHKTFTNKLLNLETAQECELQVPQTHISNYSNDLKQVLSCNGDFVCKPINETLYFEDAKFEYSSYTRKIINEELDEEIRYSNPQLIQSCIEKWVELRVFIFKDIVFSMAIFSQANEVTRVDYRDGDCSTRPRVTPFVLPDDIKVKLLNFMKISGYNTGSIDLILTKNGDYIFLEINPIGIIDMVSHPCNYYIEKEIALHIIKSIS